VNVCPEFIAMPIARERINSVMNCLAARIRGAPAGPPLAVSQTEARLAPRSGLRNRQAAVAA
jgi:hypothetical protein